MYDYLIVGAGLFGATFAYEMTKAGYRCVVVEENDRVGGSLATDNIDGIVVHKYGPHIFHTDDPDLWFYVNSLTKFVPFVNQPIANYKGEIYNLPFNMNTFVRMFPGVNAPREAEAVIRSDAEGISEIQNLEDKAISMVGRTIYEKLVKGYTEKQWGKDCTELPPDIISRLPLRFTFDNRYFNDKYQGVPKDGYSSMIEKMLNRSDVWLSTPFAHYMRNIAKHTIYTGKIDEFYGYKYGRLEYRSLRFETEMLHDTRDFQGNAVVNYTDRETPFTRITEHKHFDESTTYSDHTVITREYPAIHDESNDPYYPIQSQRNIALYVKYKELANKEHGVKFCGRLGEYKYYDMDDCMKAAIQLSRMEMGGVRKWTKKSKS